MIRLIDDPRFDISYEGEVPADSQVGCCEKVKRVAATAFREIALIPKAASNTLRLNTRYFVRLFIDIVFGVDNTSRYFDAQDLMIRVALFTLLFLAQMTLGVYKEYRRLRLMRPGQFAAIGDPSVNKEHIQSCDIKIKTDHIPEEIQVSDLLRHFDEINFQHPENIKDDAGNVIPRGQLRRSLETFVNNINTRKPLLKIYTNIDTLAKQFC